MPLGTQGGPMPGAAAPTAAMAPFFQQILQRLGQMKQQAVVPAPTPSNAISAQPNIGAQPDTGAGGVGSPLAPVANRTQNAPTIEAPQSAGGGVGQSAPAPTAPAAAPQAPPTMMQQLMDLVGIKPQGTLTQNLEGVVNSPAMNLTRSIGRSMRASKGGPGGEYAAHRQTAQEATQLAHDRMLQQLGLAKERMNWMGDLQQARLTHQDEIVKLKAELQREADSDPNSYKAQQIALRIKALEQNQSQFNQRQDFQREQFEWRKDTASQKVLADAAKTDQSNARGWQGILARFQDIAARNYTANNLPVPEDLQKEIAKAARLAKSTTSKLDPAGTETITTGSGLNVEITP